MKTNKLEKEYTCKVGCGEYSQIFLQKQIQHPTASCKTGMLRRRGRHAHGLNLCCYLRRSYQEICSQFWYLAAALSPKMRQYFPSLTALLHLWSSWIFSPLSLYIPLLLMHTNLSLLHYFSFLFFSFLFLFYSFFFKQFTFVIIMWLRRNFSLSFGFTV